MSDIPRAAFLRLLKATLNLYNAAGHQYFLSKTADEAEIKKYGETIELRLQECAELLGEAIREIEKSDEQR
jgi:hypothetical protein